MLKQNWTNMTYSKKDKFKKTVIKNVTFAGGDVLDSQFPIQGAYWWFTVSICLRIKWNMKRCQPKLNRL